MASSRHVQAALVVWARTPSSWNHTWLILGENNTVNCGTVVYSAPKIYRRAVLAVVHANFRTYSFRIRFENSQIWFEHLVKMSWSAARAITFCTVCPYSRASALHLWCRCVWDGGTLLLFTQGTLIVSPSDCKQKLEDSSMWQSLAHLGHYHQSSPCAGNTRDNTSGNTRESSITPFLPASWSKRATTKFAFSSIQKRMFALRGGRQECFVELILYVPGMRSVTDQGKWERLTYNVIIY